MTDSTKKNVPDERPIDPSRDAQDVLGDPTGLTGVTTGNPKDISAEPDEVHMDLQNEPGGQMDVKKPPKGSLGIPRDSESDKLYRQHISEGMSSTYKAIANDIASETSTGTVPSPKGTVSSTTQQGAQTITTDENSLSQSPVVNGTDSDPLTSQQGELKHEESPAQSGEQSISGDMPTPDSDDDTLAAAQSVGTQTHEDPEHPKEVDIARDVDEAEEYQKTH